MNRVECLCGCEIEGNQCIGDVAVHELWGYQRGGWTGHVDWLKLKGYRWNETGRGDGKAG